MILYGTFKGVFMKGKVFILGLIESIFFVIMLYLFIANYKINAACHFAASFSGDYAVVNTSTVILLMYLIGSVSGFLYSVVLSNRYRDQIEFYARKNEKLSQQNEIDSDDKEALQRKIASLEIALDNALKNKQ